MHLTPWERRHLACGGPDEAGPSPWERGHPARGGRAGARPFLLWEVRLPVAQSEALSVQMCKYPVSNIQYQFQCQFKCRHQLLLKLVIYDLHTCTFAHCLHPLRVSASPVPPPHTENQLSEHGAEILHHPESADGSSAYLKAASSRAFSLIDYLRFGK